MATREQLERALINADKAGDVDAARTLAAEIQKMRSQPEAVAKSAESGSYWDRIKQAAKPEMGIFRGLRDPLDAGAQMAVRGANAVGLAPDSEVARVDQINRDAEQSYQQGRGDTGFDALRLGGNILATAPLTSVAPVGAGLAARTAIGAATGAGFGALQPVANPGENFWQQKGQQAKTGAIAGGLAAPITAGLARIISPRTLPEVQALRKEGVPLTPGQIMGGAWRSLEEKAKSIPFVGSAVKGAEDRANEAFNRVAINRVLEPIKTKLPDGMIGSDAVRFAGDKVSAYYDDALSRVGPIRLDGSLSNEMSAILGKLSGTPDKAQQFVNEIQREISNRARNGVLTGRAFKDIESTLGQRAAQYRQSPIASEKDLGEAFFEAQKAMREWLQRSAPTGVADDIARANQGWAALVRVENAAGMQSAKGGVFSPESLYSGVKRAEKTVRKRGIARGEGLMQDLAVAGQKVMTPKVGNSGTADRLIPFGAGAALWAEPVMTTAGILGGSAAYSGPGVAALGGLLASRPQLAEPVSQAVRQAGVPILTGGLFGLLGQ